MNKIYKPHRKVQNFFKVQSTHKNQIWTTSTLIINNIIYLPIIDVYHVMKLKINQQKKY